MAYAQQWNDWPEFKKQKVRRLLPELLRSSPENELSHELNEEAILQVEPALKFLGVEDDEFSFLIQAVYLEYSKNGAID